MCLRRVAAAAAAKMQAGVNGGIREFWFHLKRNQICLRGKSDLRGALTRHISVWLQVDTDSCSAAAGDEVLPYGEKVLGS